VATKQSTVDYILEQASRDRSVTARKMFGEYGLYLDGRMIALVCDDQLFVKTTPGGRAFAGDCPEGIPYPNAKPCLRIDADRLEDADWLRELLRLTARDVPLGKPKKRR
jgi:TfoX/Sxy family transcriptional regulator of competence genes